MSTIGNMPKSQLYAGPGYNLFDPPHRQFEEETTFLDIAAMKNAAEAGVANDVVADDIDADDFDPDDTELDNVYLYSMTINDLRIVAGLLNLPNREQITDRSELIAAIERAP
jgi:hypothetical protein